MTGDRLARRAANPLRSGVVLNSVDNTLLAIIAEHYAMTVAQLQRGVGIWGGARVVSARAVRQRIARWRACSLVAVLERQGVNFVTLTAAGYAHLGLDYPVWGASHARIAHVRAVMDFRLWYEWDEARVAASGAWVSERRLYRERSQARWHLHDAELAKPGRDKRTGIEVELTLKTPTTARYTEILHSLGPHIDGVMYVCAPEIVNAVSRSAARCKPENLAVWVRAMPSLSDLGTERQVAS